MIFIANKQNQVTAFRIENHKPEGWETKIYSLDWNTGLTFDPKIPTNMGILQQLIALNAVMSLLSIQIVPSNKV